DEAVAVQIVAGTMAAVQIRRRILDRQIHEAELFVDGDLRPDARVSVDRPRFFFPGIVAELARARDRVEGPEELAGPRVPCADEPLRVVMGLDGEAFTERRADDDHVLRDGRCRVKADLTGLEIDLLALADNGADLHCDDAVGP